MRVAILAAYWPDWMDAMGDPSASGEHPYPWVRTLAHGLGDAGIEVHVFSISRCLSRPVEKNVAGVHYHIGPFPSRPVRKLFPVRSTAMQLGHWVRSIAPDIVHAQGAGIYSHAALTCGAPSLVTIHGLASQFPLMLQTAPRYQLRLELEVAAKARDVVAISPFVREWLERHDYRGAVYSIENPVDQVFFNNYEATGHSDSQNGSPRALFVGGLTRWKRLQDCIEAIARVDGLYLDIVTHQPPEGAYWETIAGMLANRPDVAQRVRFVGRLDSAALAARMSESLCLLLPSEAETAPLVVSESMACGLPVVAANTGGVPYMLNDGKTGFLVGVGDIDAIAQNLVVLRDSRSLRSAVRDAAHRDAETRFAVGLVVDKTLEAYAEVLA